MEDQIYTIWLPLVITVTFAIVGIVRGVLREAIVAAAVVLAASINLLWGEQWSQGLNDVYSGMDKGQEQFILNLIALWLVVPVVGYGLGSLLPKQQVDTKSWIGGALLGLASGAAMAGFTLRYAYNGLDGADASSRFYQTLLSRGFMVWAGWFPLALAFFAALFVLIVPIRRAQRAVAQPSGASNWGPSSPPQTPAPTMAASMFPPAASSVAAGGGGATATYTPGPQPTMYMPEQDAPSTTRMPMDPVQGLQPQAQDMSANEPQSSATRMFDVTPSSPLAGSVSTSAHEQGEPGAYSSFGSPGAVDASWLLQPTEEKQQQSEEREPGSLTTTTSFGTERAITLPAGTGQPVGTAQSASSVEGAKKCANCGSSVMPGAFFCTECGARVS